MISLLCYGIKWGKCWLVKNIRVTEALISRPLVKARLILAFAVIYTWWHSSPTTLPCAYTESWRQAELQEDRKEQASLRDMTLIKSDTGGSEETGCKGGCRCAATVSELKLLKKHALFVNWKCRGVSFEPSADVARDWDRLIFWHCSWAWLCGLPKLKLCLIIDLGYGKKEKIHSSFFKPPNPH